MEVGRKVENMGKTSPANARKYGSIQPSLSNLLAAEWYNVYIFRNEFCASRTKCVENTGKILFTHASTAFTAPISMKLGTAQQHCV
jgi:hypothetical protein